MDGLVIVNSHTDIARISQPNSILSLLASCGNMDVMMSEIGPDCPTFIEPGTDQELGEFFFITEGQLTIVTDEGDVELKQNDSFYVSGLKKSVFIKSGTGAKLLYVTNKPVFNYLYSFLGDLNELLRKTDEKDKYTYGHGKRVMDYSVRISERIGLDKDTLQLLAESALFHDIGKCHVPDEILNKPSELTREEFRYILKHPVHSRVLVENKLGRDIGEIAEQHHERLDGSGYPYGLCGNEIRIEARIIAVADAYDAMTTDRPYKRAKTPLEALNELNDLKGKHYDKDVVEAFGEIILNSRGKENDIV